MPAPSEPTTLIPYGKARTVCAEKNDRLGWKAGFAVEFEDGRFGFRTNDPQILQRLRQIVPAEARELLEPEVDLLYSVLVGQPSTRKGVQNYHIVYDGWSRISRQFDLDASIKFLTDYVHNHFTILGKRRSYISGLLYEFEGRKFFVCAEAEMLVSLATTLEAAGEGQVLTSTWLGVNEDGSVGPFENLKNSGPAPQFILHVAAEGTSGQSVVLPESAGVMALVPHSPGMRKRPGITLERLTRLAKQSQSYRLAAEQAEAVVQMIRSLSVAELVDQA